MSDVGKAVVQERADGKRIKLPVIGWIRMREEVRFSGPFTRAMLSCEAGRWFVSLLIDTTDVQHALASKASDSQFPVDILSMTERGSVAQPEAVVGIDLGVTTLATLSLTHVLLVLRRHQADAGLRGNDVPLLICGFEAGRDVNAALNLAVMAASSAVSARGRARSGVVRKGRVKRASASTKQEENTVLSEAA